jgi:hypothetical protein
MDVQVIRAKVPGVIKLIASNVDDETSEMFSNKCIFIYTRWYQKVFRTGAAIYTAVVVARSTGPNRPNCEFRVLLRRFAATA